MPLIKEASVEAVKSAADIVSVVEGRVRLRKAGATYKGLCPFHEERTPSFVVTPARGTYHCFGCQRGGDAISFVREAEQLDFVGAIEWLAERFGIELEYEEVSPGDERKRLRRRRLLELLDRAAAFYERCLWDAPAGEAAREYLASRGLGEEVCREFRLGLAPGGATLARRALGQGFAREELAAAGLVNQRGNDYFTRRLVFPLADARGQVRGFQARKLFEDDPLRAKYVNTREGELFRKGDLLYGLDHARASIARQERALVVEGNPDVLALRQAGFEPVVAAMGTALTEQQLTELSRLTRRIVLCFDADAAGADATLRGMELATARGFDVRVVSLPPGTDPADDPTGFETRLVEAEDYLPYRVRLELDRARDRQEGFERVRDFLAPFPDSPERQAAVRLAADRLDMAGETAMGLAPARARSKTGTVSARQLDAGLHLERSALAGVAAHPSLARVLAELGPEHFDVELHRRARAHLLGEVGTAEGELQPLLAELDARAATEAIDEGTAEQLLLRLRERRLRRAIGESDDERHKVELELALARVRTAIREFA
jgi:DNA primase